MAINNTNINTRAQPDNTRSKSVYWTDVRWDMGRAWNNDVARTENIDAVKYSLVGIITTRKGSRPFMPDFGCNLTNQLFENYNIATQEIARETIIDSIKAFEPRVAGLNVEVVGDPDNNSIEVTIYYSTIKDPGYVERIRLNLAPGSDRDTVRIVPGRNVQ